MHRLLLTICFSLIAGNANAQNDDPVYYFNPDWSPDGGKIAFESGPDRQLSIYTIDIDGKNLTQFTSNESNDEAPVWSPDGKRIAFFADRRERRDELPVALQIYIMNADGTELNQITNNGSSLDYNITWSPDGSQLAFQSRPEINPGVHSIYAVGTDGTRRRRITDGQFNDAQPQWSPDGKQILFVRSPALYTFFQDQTSEDRNQANASTEIMLLDIEDGAIAPITQNNLRETDPSWSADGSEIYFLQFAADGKKTFFRQKLGEPNAAAIADGDLVSNDRLPYKTRVSPNGRYLAYHKKIDGAPGEYAQGIYIYDLELNRERLLIGATKN